MQKQDAFDNADDEISLTELLVTIWRARWTIVVITSLVVAIGLSGSLLLAKYKSQGIFQFGGAIPLDMQKYLGKEGKEAGWGIKFADYKLYAASFATTKRFTDFVQENKMESTEGVDALSGVFLSRDGILKFIEPIYPMTKLDAKELVAQANDSSNNILGLSIYYEDSSPEVAQQMVSLLGRYVMDGIIYHIFYDELRSKPEELRVKLSQFENTIIDIREQLNEYRRRAAELQKIIGRNRGSSDQNQRQVVTVTEESARYLAPVTQLMATEIQIAEANEAILKTQREQHQNELLLEYYDRTRPMLEGAKSGETILRGLEPLKESVFKGKDLENDTVKAAYNMITIHNQAAKSVYLDKTRFISGPNLPVHSTARPVRVVAISMMLGLFLSFLFVFVQKWWRENKLQLSA